MQIADILPPPMPEEISTSIDIYIFVLVFFIVALILYFLQSRKQRLQRIRLRYQSKQINSRQCAFEIVYFLQDTGINKKHEDDVSWQAYSLILQKACYSRDSLDSRAMKQLLDKIRQWL